MRTRRCARPTVLLPSAVVHRGELQNVPGRGGKITETSRLVRHASDAEHEHQDDDGFLYMTYAGENTFGCR